MKVRWSPKFDEVLEFEVGISEIPIDDHKGKNVIVTWKVFDDFEANKTFWTDSNGLEMQERKHNFNPSYNWYTNDTQNISSNYYPVDAAIAIRD